MDRINSDQRILTLLQSFYKKTIHNHSNKNKLSYSLAQLLNNLKSQRPQNGINLFQTPHRQTVASIENESDRKSIRSTKTISQRVQSHSPTKSVSANISGDTVCSKIHDQSKKFGCKWTYSSPSPHKILLFAILETFIVASSKHKFKQLQDKINDYLSENSVFTPIIMISITRIWQNIGEMLTPAKKPRWRNALKQMVDKMPKEFAQIAISQLLKISQQIESITKKAIYQLSLTMDATVKNFVINYRQIEKTQICGNSVLEYVLGELRHQKMFVLSNRVPEYNKEELLDRQLKAKMQKTIQSLLQGYERDCTELSTMELINKQDDNQKQQTVKNLFLNLIDNLEEV